jgi:hypothetical protein
MKPISALALLSLAASFAVTGAVAQNVALKAQIPFAFTAGNSSLPAGTYTISSPSSGLVRLAGEHGEYSMITSSHSFSESKKGQNALVFDKVGSQYFLHHILCPARAQMNVDIPTWKAERNARERQAVAQTGEPVLVMAALKH